MPEKLGMEKINHPITFDLSPEDPDDEIPLHNSSLPERGVVLLPSAPNVGNTVEWNQDTIHQAIRLCRERGMVPGAIVAKRPLLGDNGAAWKVKSHSYWGIITNISTYIPGQLYNAYAPLTVRWFQPMNHQNRYEDKLFAGDLYLIHAALTEEALNSKMEAQKEF